MQSHHITIYPPDALRVVLLLRCALLFLKNDGLSWSSYFPKINPQLTNTPEVASSVTDCAVKTRRLVAPPVRQMIRHVTISYVSRQPRWYPVVEFTTRLFWPRTSSVTSQVGIQSRLSDGPASPTPARHWAAAEPEATHTVCPPVTWGVMCTNSVGHFINVHRSTRMCNYTARICSAQPEGYNLPLEKYAVATYRQYIFLWV